jgi:putative ABC transport system permease protein
MFSSGTNILSVGTKKISADGSWAQVDFPEMLTLNMTEGNRAALKDPSSILLSRSLATALFGTAGAIDRTVRVDNKIDLKVGGTTPQIIGTRKTPTGTTTAPNCMSS